MQIAAVSAILAPMYRNSQKGVKKLLMAVAADEEGLQHRDVSIFL